MAETVCAVAIGAGVDEGERGVVAVGTAAVGAAPVWTAGSLVVVELVADEFTTGAGVVVAVGAVAMAGTGAAVSAVKVFVLVAVGIGAVTVVSVVVVAGKLTAVGLAAGTAPREDATVGASMRAAVANVAAGEALVVVVLAAVEMLRLVGDGVPRVEGRVIASTAGIFCVLCNCEA
jgi:hypothetical protein